MFSFQLAIGSLVSIPLLTAARPSPLPLSSSYWKDDAFLKSFNASYRINARIEPAVTSAERGLLASVQPLMAAGNRNEALVKLKASALAKKSAAITFNVGNIQFELGKLKEAASSYQSALEIFPSFRRAHRNLGFVYARENDWDKALPALVAAIQLGDQDGATYGQLAYGRMHKEQYASALQAYRLAQLTQPDSVDWKAGTAQCLQYLRRNEEALALLDEVIQARPGEVSYYLLQASIQLSLDRADAAVTNLELVRRMGKLDAEYHLLLANLHLRAGNNELARPVMMAAIQMEEKPPVEAALNALEFTTQVRDWKLARDFAQVIATAFPDIENKKLNQKQRRLTALIDIDAGGDPERGAAMLKILINEDPLDAASLIFLARYRVTEKRYEEAEMLLQQAQRVEGQAYTAHIELAKIYVSTSRYPDAITHLDQALKIRDTEAIRTYRNAVAHLATAAE